MQDLSTLDDDFLEIEQTLSAVEKSLKAGAEAPKLKLKPLKAQKDATPRTNKTLTFRGINSAKQKNQKSIILRRDLLSKTKNHQTESTGHTETEVIITKPAVTVAPAPKVVSAPAKPQPAILPSLNVLKAKLSLKNTNNILSKIKAEQANKPKVEQTTYSIKKAEPAIVSAPKLKPDLKKEDSIKLTVRRVNVNKKDFRPLTSAEDKMKLQRLKLKISDKQRNKPEQKLNQNQNKNRAETQYGDKNLAKEHLLSLVNKTEQKKQNNQKKDFAQRPVVKTSGSAIANKKVIYKNSGVSDSAANHSQSLQNNVKLKEALIQKALSEVPMTQYHDHDANKQNLKRSYKMKAFRNLSLAGFILVFGGYLFFLNIPTISFRVAAIQSGMSQTASLPAYKPAGYSFKSKAAYGPGYVKIELKNNNGNKLELSQEKSSFDSQALKDNIVARVDGGYSTYVKDGLTIYIYNNGGASWVNKGQVYSLHGNTSDLSSDEILNMAASM